MAKSKKRGSPETRAYMRLTRHERNGIEHMLDQEKSCRAIAQELGRSPSTIKREVDRHRFITSPRALHGQPAPEDDLGRACPRLGAWPYCCNGCKKRRGYGCNRRPRVYYSARLAQQASDALLSSSRAGIDETEESARAKLEAIRDGLERGLSPEQIAHMHPELALSASTIYRWCDAGYERLSNMDLRRKVGYRPRKKRARAASTRHGPERSHQAFLAQGEDACAGAWEMDTVLGAHLDTACLLTLLHRPTRFQLVLRIAEKTSRCVEERLQSMRLVLGEDGCGRLFRSVLTDNGSEFADEDGIAHALGERPSETRLFYCDPRRSDQKGACERNHVEIRKMLPKRRGIRFDRLREADCALVMSHINSEPRGCLAWLRPIDVFRAAFPEEAQVLLDAFGIEEVPAGKLDLTPSCIERAREERGDAPLI